MSITENTLNEELTALTGKLYCGDPTRLVYDLLRCTEYKRELLCHLTGGGYNVNNDESCTALREESDNRPCIEKWLAGCEELL